MNQRTQGVLAIWSDLDAQTETDYRHWLMREHLAERVGVDGFIAGRLFRSLEPGLRRYCVLYELQTPAVLAGPSYMARQNAPTTWSQRVMPTLRNFRRGGGHVLVRGGQGRGGVISPMRFSLAALEADIHVLVNELVLMDSIGAAWVMQVDHDVTNVPTQEKAMRGGNDGALEALLVIEAAAPDALAVATRHAVARLGAAWQDGEPEQFMLCHALDRRTAGLPQD
ncbi:hypothetical protein [Kerstersia gyiorum]|jgi:hypothetical protein|uniref:hypothetical protein n=1 Tax=Kerstersia gyiorum TaxID=206506 RepID=UPI002430C25D|nr:hypothetical protein [Kerstersia gyiorum]MCH4270294.1 hypothetical protein [Kerstersia gyiorum]MCI1230282.1 hypothetical protein [Kerstersia gyiorum]